MSMFCQRPMFATCELLAAIALLFVAATCTARQTVVTGKAMVAFSIIYPQGDISLTEVN